MASSPLTAAASARAPAESRLSGARPRRRVWTWVAWIVVIIGLAVGIQQLGSAWHWWRPLAQGAAAHQVHRGDLAITLTVSGELKPRESVELRNEVEGDSTILFIVPESTKVKKGDLLVELASDQLKERLEKEQIDVRTTRTAAEAAVQELEITRNENASKLKKAEIDLAVAELELRQYLEGEFEKLLKSADIDIAQAEMDIERKRDELEKNQRLLEREFVTKSKIEQLEFELEKARMTLDKSRIARKVLLEFDRPKFEKQKRSALDQATQEMARETQRGASKEAQATAKVEEQKALLALREKRLARVQDQLGKARIIAPADGMVQYPNSENNWRSNGEPLATGQKVFEGQTLLVLPNTAQMLVTTRIHEADRHQVHEGLPVEVRVPAVPDRAFPGKISKIAKFADSANRWLNPNLKEHATEILLDATDASVAPGDSAEVKIFVKTLPAVLSVPVQCVHTRGRDSYVFRASDSGTPVAVKLGAFSATMIEIADGLREGDNVLLHADERMLARLPSAVQPRSTGEPPKADDAGKRASDSPAAAAPTTESTAAASPGGTPAPATPPAR